MVLASKLDLNFSFSFSGSLWNTAVLSEQNLLLLEVRDDLKRQVSFAAVDFKNHKIVWNDVKVKERWWVNLLAADGSTMLLQQFHGNENPDHKTLVAFDLTRFEERWQKKDVTFQSVEAGVVTVFESSAAGATIFLNLESGNAMDAERENDLRQNEISQVVQPFQYMDGTAYFETVKNFILNKFGNNVYGAAEYCEHSGMIFISYYLKLNEGLANYLLAMTADGTVVLHEKIDEQLKGLGTDTFFLLAGCLIYIRNKNELLSYTLT